MATMGTQRMLRILILNWRDITHPRAGGAEVYTHNIADEWIKEGHSVTLFCAAIEGRQEFEDLMAFTSSDAFSSRRLPRGKTVLSP